ncbi:MAG: 16S rRNA (guanine(527)-N(7))-methyltransferase RsmG [Acidobacteria bacterium RBG_16_64_8]|nr:MAG: 16S rRNA (guanine(527)-N(7))-methyltransferase RsmG [Acidobacteria bacterium RBG_16_64_8]
MSSWTINQDCGLKLSETSAYTARGLDEPFQCRLSLLGDHILGAEFNVTGLTDPREIERAHFLDSLSLLDLDCVSLAETLVDIGSGAGLPALVLALALPRTRVVAIESQRKKCAYIGRTAQLLSLPNIEVYCARAEEYGRSAGRGIHDVVVSRAVAALPVVAEYSLPLLKVGGTMVAMKGEVSDQERTQAERALGILGSGPLEALQMHPFPDAQNRWVYLARKIGATPSDYPRRPGIPAKRPLGV